MADPATDLDPDQLVAVTAPADGRPLRILAGPGAGKTRVLTRRIAHHALDGAIDPRHVMAVTFTRKAATELRDRLVALGVRDVGAVGTFHGLAFQLVRRHRLDHDRSPPTITASSTRFLRAVAGDVPLDVLRAELAWTRRSGIDPGRYGQAAAVAKRSPPGGVRGVAEALAEFQRRKRRAGVLDFDDLIVECADLLRQDGRFAEATRWRFRYLFVDEFQDLNAAQFGLLQAWLGDRRDLCVVGDADQAIYGWNGADARYLVEFERFWPDARTIALTANHRCPPRLAAAAAAVLGRSVESGPDLPGPAPTITDYADARAEAEGVVAAVRRLRPVGGRWRNVAVLARTNDQLELIATALTDHAVPYRIRTRATDLRSPEVQRVLDVLTTHVGDLRSIVDELWHELGPDHPGAVALSIAEQLLVDEPRARASELAGFVRGLRPGDLSGRTDAVELCTFHSAKGLEWPHVLVVGVEAGLVPLRDDDPEERRLLYVGMTRASRSLHLSWARTRTVDGRQVSRRPSPLLDVIVATATEPPPAAERDARAHLAAIRADTHLVPTAPDDQVVAELRGWRDRQARVAGVAAAAVASDRLLAELAASRPRDLDELASLTGWGVLRCRRFGPEVLTLVAAQAS